MSYTATRQLVQTELASILGIAFVGGRVDGPIEDRDLGCVWTSTIAPADDITVQNVDIRVRVFKQWKLNDLATGDEELLLAALEALAEQVQAALSTIKASGSMLATGAWFLQTIPDIEIDTESAGIEASVIVARANPFIG